MKQKVLKSLLRFFTRGMLRRHQPLIVGITGSVGKSSAKEAVALALSEDYGVRKTAGNLNNEFGIPLTVFGLTRGGEGLFSWAGILLKIFFIRYFSFRYPEALVLEMGVDRPGDMKYLLELVPVDIGVVTHVSESHLKYFKTLQGIAKEKGELVRHFSAGKGIAVLNADNPYTQKMGTKTNAALVLTYGFSPEAIVRGTNQVLIQGGAGQLPFYSLKIEHAGKTFPLRLPNIVAEHHIQSVLAAVAVALSLKLNLVEVAKRLEAFAPLPGRLRVIPGAGETLILDDTYNASPVSTKEAIKVLGRLPSVRRVAVLGDMLELGPESDQEHANLYPFLQAAHVHTVVLVGSHMKALYQEFKKENEGTAVFWEADPLQVAKNIKSILQPGDTILIKGSQGMRMELVTKALLADEGLAQSYLCRQTPAWLAKPFVAPEE